MNDEFNMTGIFDGLFSGVSRKTGVPNEDYSAIFGGQLYGQLLEVVFDITMNPAIAGVVDGVVGAGEMLYSTMAEGVNPRLRKETFSMGTKMVMELLDPKTWTQRKTAAEEVKSKIEEGDVIGAIFKPPEEILKALGLESKKPVKVVKTTKGEVSTNSNVVEVPVESGNEEPLEKDEEMWRKLSA